MLNNLDIGPGNIFLPDQCVLWPFKPIKQVGTQRPIKVRLKAGNNMGKNLWVSMEPW